MRQIRWISLIFQNNHVATQLYLLHLLSSWQVLPVPIFPMTDILFESSPVYNQHQRSTWQHNHCHCHNQVHNILKSSGYACIHQWKHIVSYCRNPIHNCKQVYSHPQNPIIVLFNRHTAHCHTDNPTRHIECAQLFSEHSGRCRISRKIADSLWNPVVSRISKRRQNNSRCVG